MLIAVQHDMQNGDNKVMQFNFLSGNLFWLIAYFLTSIILDIEQEKIIGNMFLPLICTLIRKSQASCNIYPIFSGWQKHLRFFRAWHPFFSDLPYETQLLLRFPT